MAEDTKRGAGLWVLVAEDNLTNQTLLVRLIERAGHMAVVVANGEEAIVRLERRGHFGDTPIEVPPFDLVLMDIQMPVLGGVEAALIIRDRERTGAKRIPIVALTAHEIPKEHDEYLNEGLDYHLTKPIDPLKLRGMFDEVVGRKGDCKI